VIVQSDDLSLSTWLVAPTSTSARPGTSRSSPPRRSSTPHASWGARMAVDAAFTRAGVTREMALEVNDLRLLLDLVTRCLGVGFAPASFAKVTLLDMARAPTW